MTMSPDQHAEQPWRSDSQVSYGARPPKDNGRPLFEPTLLVVGDTGLIECVGASPLSPVEVPDATEEHRQHGSRIVFDFAMFRVNLGLTELFGTIVPEEK